MSQQLPIDWERPEIGRIRGRYGLVPRERSALIDALNTLYRHDRLSELKAIARGDITFKELMEVKAQGNLLRSDLLALIKLGQPLWDTLEAMIAERHGGDKHKRRMRDSLKKLRAAKVFVERATIGDLANIKKQQLRPFFQSAADWNHLRKAILTPLTQLFGDNLHPFRRDVAKALGQREQEPDRPLNVTPELFWQLVEALPVHAKASVITLAVTGMRLNTEYLKCKKEDLRPIVYGVYCRGSKNADATGIIRVSQSLWPWIMLGIPSPLQVKQLGTYFRRAREAVGLPELTLHDLRHLTAIFAFEGGAQFNEVQAMMRHADPKMTARYAAVKDRGNAAEAIGRALERPSARAD